MPKGNPQGYMRPKNFKGRMKNKGSMPPGQMKTPPGIASKIMGGGNIPPGLRSRMHGLLTATPEKNFSEKRAAAYQRKVSAMKRKRAMRGRMKSASNVE